MHSKNVESLPPIIESVDETHVKETFSIQKVRINDRGGRMKISFNLNKDQGVAYKNFREAFKPDQLSENDFMVSLLINGMKRIQEEFEVLATQYAKENREELASSGITFVENEDGSIKFLDNDAQA